MAHSEITPQLFISDNSTPRQLPLLNSLQINCILPIQQFPLVQFPDEFEYFPVTLTDEESSNIFKYLPQTCEFIENSVKNGKNVLVHCEAGVSRSATIITAYLMKSRDLSVNEALSELRKVHPRASPNRSFFAQLALFSCMNCSIDAKNRKYRLFCSKLLAVQKGDIGLTPADYSKKPSEFITEMQQIDSIIPQTPRSAQLRCKKCRLILASSEQVQDHETGMGEIVFNHTKRTINYIKEQQRNSTPTSSNPNTESASGASHEPDRTLFQFSTDAARTCSSFFLEPLEWMKGINDGENEGKINCPKCDSKLGGYCWAGQPCSCGAWIAPAFSVARSKVDVQMLQ
ncbi:hypothetical protein HK098_001935 [Nowakowskiella sp. JEL0407]|nr:hypothetical protein HK098_001935 [Nowakowskiella sp. JEL0407]